MVESRTLLKECGDFTDDPLQQLLEGFDESYLYIRVGQLMGHFHITTLHS